MTEIKDSPDCARRQRLLWLAERCESEEPSIGLDEDIAIVLNRWGTADDVFDWPPAFTHSLDAAVTLVPEGMEWLRKSSNTMTVYRPPSGKEWAQHVDGEGATPALALCAAALRSRAQEV